MRQPGDQPGEALDERRPVAPHLRPQLLEPRARPVDEARFGIEGVEDLTLELELLGRDAEPLGQERPPRALLAHEAGEPARGLERARGVDQRPAVECRALDCQDTERALLVLDEGSREPRDLREIHPLGDLRERGPRLGEARARLPPLQRAARERRARRSRHQLAHAVPLQRLDRLRIEPHRLPKRDDPREGGRPHAVVRSLLTPGAPSRAR